MQDRVLEGPVRGTEKGFSCFEKVLLRWRCWPACIIAANAAGDAKAGEVVKPAPYKGGGDAFCTELVGIVGRKAATRPGFAYSGPLQKAGIVWTEANLIKWAAGPARMVPGNKMAFPGITSKKQQADLVAYLGTLK